MSSTSPRLLSASYLGSLPKEQREAFYQSLTPEELHSLNSDWRFWARDNQLPPDSPEWYIWNNRLATLDPKDAKKQKIVGIDEIEQELWNTWFIWMILAGRGFGKTWVGANWINECAEKDDGEGHFAIMGRDAHDVRSYQIEGPSGILAQADPGFMPLYEPSKRLITWPNGTVGHIYYAEAPKSVRGPNHRKAWCDEPASWQDANQGDAEDTAWSNLLMTMRIGENPQILVTGTPKPLKLIRQIQKYINAVVVRGRTYDNKANLSKQFFLNVVAKYAGTRLGRQEIDGEILDDNPDALWQRDWIEATRVKEVPDNMDRIVVAIDPSVSGVPDDEEGTNDAVKPAGAEAGIIVAGKKGRHYYILADESLRDTPLNWAKAAIAAYRAWLADKLVAEKNNGGEMVRVTINAALDGANQDSVNFDLVWASRGKVTRAEPIAAIYEQKRVHHVGAFIELEDQMCFWQPGDPSPDRLDAMVWAMTELSEGDEELTEADEAEYEGFWNRTAGDMVATNDLHNW